MTKSYLSVTHRNKSRQLTKGRHPWYAHTVIVLVQLAIGNLHKVPNIHEGRDDLEDKPSGNARDNATRHGHRHGTTANLVPAENVYDINMPSMDNYDRN